MKIRPMLAFAAVVALPLSIVAQGPPQGPAAPPCVQEGKNSRHTLYVVNHGKRESIEVFELDAKVRPPTLTWIGCVVAPEPVGLNSVLPLPDGGFIGTDFLERGANAAAARGKMLAGENN